MLVPTSTPLLPLLPPPPPRPIAIGTRARLRVVQDGAQDCSTCRNMHGCWTAKGKAALSDGDIVSNLLVCRIQRNISRDKSIRMLLKLIRPKLKKTARWVADQTDTPLGDVVHDLESVAVQTLMTDYVMGELAPPLVWLFNAKHGGIRHWVMRTMARARREKTMLLSYDGTTAGEAARDDPGALDWRARDDLESRIARLNSAATHGMVHEAPPWLAGPEADETDPAVSERCAVAMDVVEDGKTLTTAEYRVFKFCLRNARGSLRMTDWLHQHLAAAMGIPRKDVSRLYGMAYRKLLDAVGLRDAYLRARGIEPPKERRTERTRPLSADEVIAAIHILEMSKGRATILDVAWALGVTDMTVHSLRRRFTGMSPEMIREAMRKKA